MDKFFLNQNRLFKTKFQKTILKKFQGKSSLDFLLKKFNIFLKKIPNIKNKNKNPQGFP